MSTPACAAQRLGSTSRQSQALAGAAISAGRAPLDAAFSLEENGSPASARGSPLTFGEDSMTTSDYSLIIAVVVLLSILVYALRFKAHEAASPKKELRLRTRWDADFEKKAAIPASEVVHVSPDILLKLPRRKPEEPGAAAPVAPIPPVAHR